MTALGLLLATASSLAAGYQVPDSLSAGDRPAPSARAPVVATPPVIDGRLTDAAWRNAPPLTGFIQRELHEGEPVTERTEVRIITDGEALYVGAWLYDRDPAGIVPGEQVRDGEISRSDYFGILLGTYRDRQNGFVFTTTPAGIEYDAQVVKEGEGADAVFSSLAHADNLHDRTASARAAGRGGDPRDRPRCAASGESRPAERDRHRSGIVETRRFASASRCGRVFSRSESRDSSAQNLIP